MVSGEAAGAAGEPEEDLGPYIMNGSGESFFKTEPLRLVNQPKAAPAQPPPRAPPARPRRDEGAFSAGAMKTPMASRLATGRRTPARETGRATAGQAPAVRIRSRRKPAGEALEQPWTAVGGAADAVEQA